MRRKLWIILATALIFLGIIFAFKACSYDFSNWEFEKYQSAFKTVAEIVRHDYKKLNSEIVIYLENDGKLERVNNTEHVIVVDMHDLIEKLKAFRPCVFDGIDAYKEQVVFIYGVGSEYIIHTYDGKTPDYSFLDGLDFYTGKLADGWYVAKLRLR